MPVMGAPGSTHETEAATEEEALIRAHLAAMAWIETHLLEPMTVKSIADRAGYSPSRFSRGFTRLQGESVMSYVRGRRLEAAMRRLLTEPDVRIVDLAFDSGFDSQEAFTRAFARAFGHPPGRLRSLGPVSSVLRRRKASRIELEIYERVEVVPELHLAGLIGRVTPANSHELLGLWRRLDSLRGFPGALDASTYLVILDVDRRDGAVEMMPSLRVNGDASPPPELREHCVPAGTSTVFRHVVRKGDIYPQIQAAREAIFKSYQARPAHTRSPLPAFEVYPQGLDVTAGSWVDHYFPMREHTP
jgi:AraC-like DNA-binding protein/predicted transcriptional regulator YdeE